MKNFCSRSTFAVFILQALLQLIALLKLYSYACVTPAPPSCQIKP